MDPGSDQGPSQYSTSRPKITTKREGTATSKTTPDTTWTVYSPNILRGNLENEVNEQDVRMSVGWRADSTAAQRQGHNSAWTAEPQAGAVQYTSRDWAELRDDEATPRPKDYSTSYPHPNLSLPHPSLNLDFRMSVDLNPRISVGPTPLGHRNWISFTGGSWSGSWGSGTVLPGGQDSQLIIPNGAARIDTNYILQTLDDNPAHIVVKTSGWRTGPPEILAKLADPEQADSVNPNMYRFRIFIEMETGDDRYRDNVNCGMWVGSGMRKGAEVIYDAYRIS